MLVPSIFNDNFVDNFFDDMFLFPGFTSGSRSVSNVMKTDIQDLGENYQLDIELPGFAKEDIHAELSGGYLTITAQKSSENEEKDEDGKYIRRERYSGSCRRSFHIGDNLSHSLPNYIHIYSSDGRQLPCAAHSYGRKPMFHGASSDGHPWNEHIHSDT